MFNWKFWEQDPPADPLRITAMVPADGHEALLTYPTGQRFATVIAWCVLQTSDSVALVEGLILENGRIAICPMTTGKFERYVQIEEGLHGD